MSVDFDPGADFAESVDGLEAVSLRRIQSGEVVPVSAALRREVTTEEAEPSGGAARQTDAVWHLQLPTGAQAPELGDTVIDPSSNHWTILQIEEFALLSRWKCETRELRVAFCCDDRVDVERAVWDDLGSGPEIVDWTFVYTALPVKIQPDETVVSDTSNMPTSTARFKIILGDSHLR